MADSDHLQLRWSVSMKINLCVIKIFVTNGVYKSQDWDNMITITMEYSINMLPSANYLIVTICVGRTYDLDSLMTSGHMQLRTANYKFYWIIRT